MGLPTRPEKLVSRIVKTPQTRHEPILSLDQAIFRLLETMSTSIDAKMLYATSRAFILVAMSALDGEKHQKLVERCKNALSEKFESPDIELSYQNFPDRTYATYTFAIQNKKLEVGTEVYSATYERVENAEYLRLYTKMLPVIGDLLKTLVEEKKIPWKFKLDFSLTPVTTEEEEEEIGEGFDISFEEENPEGEEEVLEEYGE